MIQNECDKYGYIENIRKNEVIICLYVDDMLILSKNIDYINATKRMLSSKFNIKDLGVVYLILGIMILKTPLRLALCQSHYIESTLHKFNYLNFNIVKNPIDLSFTFQKNEDKSDSQLEYARVLGSLMHFTNRMQPDIACAISKLSHFTSNLNQTH